MHYEDLGSVDYRAAWEVQREAHAGVADGGPARVLLLEHPPVFTCGKRTDPGERPVDPGGAEVIDVDRGGKITFHGPGQLVGYPIVRLPEHVLVVDYVRRVEEALIGVCAQDLEKNTSAPTWLLQADYKPIENVMIYGKWSRGYRQGGLAIFGPDPLQAYDKESVDAFAAGPRAISVSSSVKVIPRCPATC